MHPSSDSPRQDGPKQNGSPLARCSQSPNQKGQSTNPGTHAKTNQDRNPRIKRGHRAVVGRALAVLFVLGAVFVVESLAGHALAQAQEQASARKADDLLSAWQLAEAKQMIESLAEGKPQAPEVLYLKGRHAFFEGRYGEAVQLLDQALAESGPRPDWQSLRDVVANTAEVTQKYTSYRSPEGYFELYYEPGKDEVLIPYAAEALDRAYKEVGEELGYFPDTPVRVEIYPQTATLAKVSVLTEEEIRTSGTIALCKYNRLMITSPKALLRGYGWVDTLVHEYVHYVINAKTSNRVPIWMHEGMAKFLERRWRGEGQQRLPPSSEHLLSKRVKTNNLITFEQMHPSMAKLPSQEDAAVAFAEVYTVMEYLDGRKGPRAFKRVLDAINSGDDAQRAFAGVLGVSWKAFERDWQGYLKGRKTVAFPEDTGFEDRLMFKEKNESLTEVSQIPKPEARDHFHLGQMLQTRDRCAAAVVQYRKAERLLGTQNPILQTRLAQCLNQTQHPDEALLALETVREAFPSYVVTWLELGKAAKAVGDFERARSYLLEAAYINPFDPEVHTHLADVYMQLGQSVEAERERKFINLVQ